MKGFTFANYEFSTHFKTNGLQEHLDEFIVLARLLGYEITCEQFNQDIFFKFKNEKDFFDINFKRTLNSPYRVFIVEFRGRSLKMSLLKNFNFMSRQVDNTKDIIKTLDNYKEVM